jgi:hypothetical protein
LRPSILALRGVGLLQSGGGAAAVGAALERIAAAQGAAAQGMGFLLAASKDAGSARRQGIDIASSVSSSVCSYDCLFIHVSHIIHIIRVVVLIIIIHIVSMCTVY